MRSFFFVEDVEDHIYVSFDVLKKGKKIKKFMNNPIQKREDKRRIPSYNAKASSAPERPLPSPLTSPSLQRFSPAVQRPSPALKRVPVKPPPIPDSSKKFGEAISTVWKAKEGFLTFQIGDRFLVEEKVEDKYKVCCMKDGRRGLVSANCISIISEEVNTEELISRGRSGTTFNMVQQFQKNKPARPEGEFVAVKNPDIAGKEPPEPLCMLSGGEEGFLTEKDPLEPTKDPLGSSPASPQAIKPEDSTGFKHHKFSALIFDNPEMQKVLMSTMSTTSVFNKPLEEVMKDEQIPLFIEHCFSTLTKLKGDLFYSEKK